MTYEGCEALTNGSLQNAAGNIDTNAELFDRETGVLRQCVAFATNTEIICYEAPANNPQVCECPNTASDLPDGCDVPLASYIGDGFCDSSEGDTYNTEACNWDGGDCCESTCVSATYSCGVASFVCLNTEASSYDACPASSSSLWGDGFCDQWVGLLSADLNTASCNWDGGDCCESTCSGSDSDACSHAYWNCEDPTATDFGVASECAGLIDFPSFLGDGYCDGFPGDGYNSDACGWDAGDCCTGSCVSPTTTDGAGYECGTAGYLCYDSTQPSYVLANCSVQFPSYIGDGYCDGIADDGYNTEACDWDGGDCCRNTCVTVVFECGTAGFLCLDPSSTDNGCPAMNTVAWGDGFCDQWSSQLSFHLNTEVCAWDGGDCCDSTCVTESGGMCTHSVWDCLDPSASDYGYKSDCDVDYPSWLGDGYCDSDADENYNTHVCGWDGGDCCIDTCSPREIALNASAAFNCGTNGYECLDASQTNEEDPQGSGDTMDPSTTLTIGIVVSVLVVAGIALVAYFTLKAKRRRANSSFSKGQSPFVNRRSHTMSMAPDDSSEHYRVLDTGYSAPTESQSASTVTSGVVV